MAALPQFLAEETILVIDGLMQKLVNRVDFRTSLSRVGRVYARWMVPDDRLEWDGRESAYHGRTHRISLMCGRGEILANGDARCAHFAVGHPSTDHAVMARAIFVMLGPEVAATEAKGGPSVVSPSVKRNPFGYDREDR